MPYKVQLVQSSLYRCSALLRFLQVGTIYATDLVRIWALGYTIVKRLPVRVHRIVRIARTAGLARPTAIAYSSTNSMVAIFAGLNYNSGAKCCSLDCRGCFWMPAYKAFQAASISVSAHCLTQAFEPSKGRH
ncbi:hypothetical protein ABBQ32_003221 [Trebouxia sp. C0010 RCD-2024]